MDYSRRTHRAGGGSHPAEPTERHHQLEPGKRSLTEDAAAHPPGVAAPAEDGPGRAPKGYKRKHEPTKPGEAGLSAGAVKRAHTSSNAEAQEADDPKSTSDSESTSESEESELDKSSSSEEESDGDRDSEDEEKEEWEEAESSAVVVTTEAKLDLHDFARQAEDLTCSVQLNGKKRGWGTALIDYGNKTLTIYELQVDEDHQRKGYGRALMLAFCLRAEQDARDSEAENDATKNEQDVLQGWKVSLVADESQTPNLREYYGRVGLEVVKGEAADQEDRFPMSGELSTVLAQLRSAAAVADRPSFEYKHH